MAASIAVVTGMLLGGPVQAQEPEFKYAGDEARKELAVVEQVVWKASAQAGLLLATGNAPLRSFTGGVRASRQANRNRLQIEASGAFVSSDVLVTVDSDQDGVADVIARDSRTISNAIAAKARYDRFLTAHDALYVTAAYLRDVPAGKAHVAGGQTGYSRLLLKHERHELASELGYDFSYEIPNSDTLDSVSIHSARAFVGYAGRLSDDTGVDSSVEALFNVNALGNGVEPFEDTRLNGRVGLTTKLFEDISLRLGFEARYDHAPATIVLMGVPYEAEKLDTKTDVSLIVNFL